MVMATAGVNGLMAKGKKSKGSEGKGGRGAGGKDPLAFIQQNSELRHALAQIEKAYGTGAIMPLGAECLTPIQGISSGSLSVDLALGGKGFPRGRIIEVYGPESSGKTTIALHSVAAAQRAGGIAAFIDAEHALDPSWAKKLGISLEQLLVSQPTSGEEALQIVETLIKSNAVDIIVVDSVAALVPQKELDGEMGDSIVGVQARLMSQAMRKLTGAIAKSKTTVIFINQLREKIGVMFGSPETTPGGKALKFYASCRVDVRLIGTLKDGEEVVGQRVKVKVVKKGCPAVPYCRVRHDACRRHQRRGRHPRPSDCGQAGGEVGHLAAIRREPAWAGSGAGPPIPQGESRRDRGTSRKDPRLQGGGNPRRSEHCR